MSKLYLSSPHMSGLEIKFIKEAFESNWIAPLGENVNAFEREIADYVGDSSNVINIVSGQEYPAGYSYDSIEIQSETEPYGLTVFLKDEPSAAKLEDELQVNADMTFDLIGNLGTIDYKTADSKEIIASYER